MARKNSDESFPVKRHDLVLGRVLTPLRTALFAAENLNVSEAWAIRSALAAVKKEYEAMLAMDKEVKVRERKAKARKDDDQYRGDLFDL